MTDSPPENEPKPAGSIAGIVGLILGMLSLLAAGVCSASIHPALNWDTGMEMGLTLLVALFAFGAIGSGFASLLRHQDRSQVSAGIGLILGVFALVGIGLAVLIEKIGEWANRNSFEPEVVEILPIVLPEESLTVADYKQAWKEWLVEHVAEPTKSSFEGHKSERVVGEIMDGFVDDYSDQPDQLSFHEWNQISARFVDLGNHGFPAGVLLTAPRSERAVNVIGMVSPIRNLRTKEDNLFLHLILELQRAEMMGRTGSSQSRSQSHEKALDALDQMLGEGWFDEDSMWLLADLTYKDHFRELEIAKGEVLLEVYESHDLPEWLLCLLRGKKHIRDAWKARGGGYANTVSSDGWQVFYDQLELARAELTSSWELAPEYSFAAFEMIEVSMGISDYPLNDMRLWFDRATAASADAFPIYSSYLWGIRPRWHGSHEAILSFGEACLNTGRFDTRVPKYYLNALSSISDEEGLAPYQKPGVYENLVRVFEGYLDQNPGPEEERTWRTTWAVAALISGHYDDVKTQAVLLQYEFCTRVLNDWWYDTTAFTFRSHVGEGSQLLKKAAKNEEDGNYAKAAKLYLDAASEEHLSKEEREFLELWAERAELRSRFESGESIELLDTNPELWNAVEGEFSQSEDGSISVRSNSIRFAIEHQLGLGENFGVELVMQARDETLQNAGAGFHLSSRWFDSEDWNTFHMRTLDDGTRTFRIAPYRYASYLSDEVKKRDMATLRLECRGNRWSAFLDGESLHRGDLKIRKTHFSNDTRLCLGGWTSRPTSKFEQVYTSVKVRKLESVAAEQ